MTRRSVDTLDAVMQGLRTGAQTSNIRQLELNQQAPEPAAAIGLMLAQMPNLSNRSYKLNFDPVQEIFLRKLVSEEMLNHRLIVKAEDFFPSIVATDYYCSTVAGGYEAVDALLSLAQALEARDRSLDPTTRDVVQTLAEYTLKGWGHRQPDARFVRRLEERYSAANTGVDTPYAGLRKISAPYLECGHIVVACAGSLSSYLARAGGREDIRALICTSMHYEHISNEQTKQAITARLDRGEYLKASLTATIAVAQESTMRPLNRLLEIIT